VSELRQRASAENPAASGNRAAQDGVGIVFVPRTPVVELIYPALPTGDTVVDAPCSAVSDDGISIDQQLA